MKNNSVSRDQEIGASIIAKLGLPPEAITYDEEGNLVGLDLSSGDMSLDMFQIEDLRDSKARDEAQFRLLPTEIWQLVNLQSLNLRGNQLSELPTEIWQLVNLHFLDLSRNQLSELPSEIGQLVNLETLDLRRNQLSKLPSEIGQLVNLWSLRLDYNTLNKLPFEIGQLSTLVILDLGGNQLSELPSEIWQLVNLHFLDLSRNQLSELPSEIGQLVNLRTLGLIGTQLRTLPLEIGQLSELQLLALEGNPYLLSPPPEIAARDTSDVLTFLRELQEDSLIRYEAKLLVVGEGGTGKSSLLRKLRDEDLDPDLSTTHGIEVGRLTLPQPDGSQTPITLNTWDFGGQQIYHATHQFFLTQRSVYLVVWNARLGADQGRLNYWLDTIKALAPDEPVLLVATHIDERAPDLNYQLYKDAYPQLIGSVSVSNVNEEGLAELKATLANAASKLPVMGQPWPRKWMEAEKTLLARPEHHFDANTYSTCCSYAGVDPDIARGTLGNYLHDLGKILYFREDDVLSNLVVLKPNWVTKAISYVLEDESTRQAKGILRHMDLPHIWATDEDGQPYERHLYPVFLRLMEKFDLSYQVQADVPGDPTTHSLIPQLLPHEPPDDLSPWPETPPDGQREVEMIYRLDFVPAGIMSWFIVRTHRYTQNMHWREGVILEYEGHRARVELNPMLRTIRLVVQGSVPYNFFTILKNTIDLILDRFAGLGIQRDVPCICHRQRNVAAKCTRFYLYEDLARRMEAERYDVECPEFFVDVSVPAMLYGIHASTNEQVILDIKQGQEEIASSLRDLPQLRLLLEGINQRSELIWRDSTRLWNFAMKNLEAECPNTFFLLPADGSPFNPKNWVSREYRLYLMCQHPPGPHSVDDSYQVRQAEEWWMAVSPWLNQLIKFLKFGIPMAKAIGAVYDEASVEKMKAGIGLMEEITKNLPQATIEDSMKRGAVTMDTITDQKVIGPSLRAVCSFLNQVARNRSWGGLYKTVTPDGNILWLCGEHRQQYEVKPLVLG